ncbi:hypothetical protein [Aeromicrobium terrae]|uniref:DUF4352 domain-containing protein n=1 Tax=Aeromicrobium terrae TaxID=2498846 RepID=A0A5C8NH86_9ACTN|nr:hypothetical protein [Aeromicrobium terrae]TXL61169.1 hypothetical protein FHP06_06955 [Aeromicrobium terrae]
MKPVPSSRRPLVAAALAAALLVAGCSSGSGGDDEPKADVPKGFDVPAGVTLTAAGSTVKAGESASVVYEVDDAASAITVRVKAVRKGTMKDFRFFSLDAAGRASTPYYVDVAVRNEGPAGLGGVTLPVLAHTASNTVYPPNELVGTFKPCPSSALPKSFLKGATAQLCMIFLLPKGETLSTVDLQTGSEADAIHWRP